jgi:acetyltransferase-like isoleucine patch superfamily enzyme
MMILSRQWFSQIFRNMVNIFCQRQLLKQYKYSISPDTKIRYCNIKPQKNSKLIVGTGSIIEGNLFFECENSSISIGENTYIGSSSVISSEKIDIGSDVLISWGCTIVDHNSHSLDFQKRKNDVKDWFIGTKDWSNVVRKPIFIRNNSWIGFNSIILKGVTIGEGAIVGAGSVVTKDVPPYTIVAGNPARIIREIPENER